MTIPTKGWSSAPTRRSAGVRAGGRTPGRGRRAGPGKPGPCSRLALGGCGLPSERDRHARLVRVAVDHDLDLVAGLVRGDRVAKLFDRGNPLAPEGDDDVAAEHERLACDDNLRLAALQACVVGTRVLRDRLHDDAPRDGEVVLVR